MDDTMKKLLETIMNMAEQGDYTRLTRTEIAKQAKVSVGLISYYFGTMVDLKKIIVREAVTRKHPRIVARAILSGYLRTKEVPKKMLDECKKLFD